MPVLRWLERHFEEAICCIALVVISLCVMTQVIIRYIPNITFGLVPEVQLHWTEEVSAIAMAWAVYMGAALCVRERYHIRIMIAVQSLPTRFGKFVIFIADLFWAAFSIFMIRVSIDYLAVLWKFPSRTPALGINEFYPQTILVIGYGLMLLRLCQTYVLWLRDGRQGLPGALEEDWDVTDTERTS